MINNNLVSVVIPSFNHKKYISKAIESVLSQTYKNLELIIIDDGSTDGTFELLKEKYSYDKRIILKNRINKGAHNTLNECISISRGNFISILNSDDYYEPNRIQVMLEQYVDDDDYKLCITNINFINELGDVISSIPEVRYFEEQYQYWKNGADIFLTGNIAITTSNYFFNKSLINKIGNFSNYRYVHDWEFALRCKLNQIKIKFVDEKLLNYRVHSSNTIKEQDIWLHIAENSKNFALFLLKNKSNINKGALNLYLNESFLVFYVIHLYFLYYGKEEQLENTSIDEIKIYLKNLKTEVGIEFEDTLSYPSIKKKI
jgi:glycosyltransferase involved in cell wall biosynthesis